MSPWRLRGSRFRRLPCFGHRLLAAFILRMLAAAILVSPVAGSAGEDKVTLRFVNADIESVVRAVAQLTGKTMVVDPRVKGTLTLSSAKPMTRAQALAALRAALRLQGIAIVESAGIARVVAEGDAKVQPGPVESNREKTAIADEVVTRIFHLKYESALGILPLLRPLVTASNPINAYAGSNSIIVTDYAGNVRRLAEIIESVDTPSSGEIEVVRLQHAIASDLAVLVARLIDSGAVQQGAETAVRVSVQADPTTNSLLIRAPSPARAELVKRLVGKLDQPLPEATGNVHVVPLRNAEAAALAKTLAGVASTKDAIMTPMSMGQRSPAAGTSPPTAQAAASAAPMAIAGMQGQAIVQADTATNSLIVTAPEHIYRQLRAVIDKLDVRRAQVLVECLIVEVSSTDAAEFGIQWQTGLSNIGSSSTNAIAGTNFGGPTQNIASASKNLAALGRGLNVGIIKGTVTLPGIGEITNLTLLARALETISKANILSMPVVMTLDNEDAQILVGQNVPIVTGQYVTPGTGGIAVVNPFQTIQRMDIGVSLKVRPQISEGGTIKLGIYQEVSSVDTSTVNPADVILNKRATETSVLVETGSIVVLGGLISNSLTSVREKVPVLGNIPGLGWLFRYDSRQQVKTNLMVFIRPVMVRGEAVSKSLAVDRYDYLRKLEEENLPEKNIVLPPWSVPALPKLEDKLGAPVSQPSEPKPDASR